MVNIPTHLSWQEASSHQCFECSTYCSVCDRWTKIIFIAEQNICISKLFQELWMKVNLISYFSYFASIKNTLQRVWSKSILTQPIKYISKSFMNLQLLYCKIKKYRVPHQRRARLAWNSWSQAFWCQNSRCNLDWVLKPRINLKINVDLSSEAVFCSPWQLKLGFLSFLNLARNWDFVF